MPSQSKTGAVHKALRGSEQQFQLLVQAVKDYAIFMLDPQGRITTWNSGAERIKGYPRSCERRPKGVMRPRAGASARMAVDSGQAS